jgi:6-phosphogluconolactonase
MEILLDCRENLETNASGIIKTFINKVLLNKDNVIFDICGGRSVAKIFSLLINENIPWDKVHIFFVDERLVNLDNKYSNFKLAYDSFINVLIDKGKINRKNIHPFIYTHEINRDLENYKPELLKFSDKFDIILLSAGENSYVACLHTNHEKIFSDKDYFIVTNNSPKEPNERMTATIKLLMKSEISILLFFGEEKRIAFNDYINETKKIIDCPVKLVNNLRESYILSDIF